jgi:uncharacterized protein (DUF488 family)
MWMMPKHTAGWLRPVASDAEMQTIFTIGHSTRTVPELTGLLRQVSVDLLVDIRSVPGSRTNPQFNTDALPAPLAVMGIGYRHIAALGGLRGRRKDAAPSQNTLWTSSAFRNYADYALTGQFRSGLEELIKLAGERRCAIMCAEAVWWRCHRRIVADYLLVQGVPVEHIMGPGKVDPARLTPGARPQPDGTVLYPIS